MLQLLQQPYPIYFSRRKSLLIPLLAGAFVAVFLIAFQPFGLQQWDPPQKWLLLSRYGLITCLMMLAWQFLLFTFLRKEKKWTLGKEILAILLLIMGISLCNWLYSAWLGLATLQPSYLWDYVGMTFMIGIFPSVFIPLINYLQKLKKHTRNSNQINQHLARDTKPGYPDENLITLLAENGKDIFSYSPSNLYFIPSADNYATIFYQEPEQERLHKNLIRGSLNRLEEQLANTSVKRCHRSYLVNLALVEQVSGNAQGYQLHLPNGAPPIPVSRKYAPEILSHLRNLP